MTTLVTGGTGYVGGAIARALVARGDRVRVLARRQSKTDKLIALGIEIAVGDILDQASLEAALDGCDTLYHAAAIYQFWVPDKDELIRTEVEGTRNAMAAARKRRLMKVVYTSSTLAIGERAGEVGNEATRHEEVFPTAYGEAKYRAELVAHDAARSGLPVVIVNPAGVYGPGGVGATSDVVVSALNGRLPMALHGTISLVYVDDAVAGHLLAEEKGRVGERYILSGTRVDAAEHLRLACRLAGVKPPIVGPRALARVMTGPSAVLSRLTGRPPIVARDTVTMLAHGSMFDGSRAERELGLRYTPADDGLRNAIAWYWQEGLLRRKPTFLD